MGFFKKAYNAGLYFRKYCTRNEILANTDTEYSEYVRSKRRKNNFPDTWIDELRIHPQQTWKVKRRTQYRPDGRNAYQIIFKIKWEKVDTFQAQFATNDGYKMFSYRYPSEPLKSYDYLFWKQDLEEMFRFQGIVIRKFWEDIDPETHIQVVRCKVYGDRKEGVRRYAQMICDRFGEQMEVEYI